MRSVMTLLALVLVAGCAGGLLGWQNAGGGEGWRLLADGRTSADDAYRVRAATNADEWQALWSALDTVNPPPEVDLASEIAVSFAHGVGSSCPELRLDGVVIEHSERVVYSTVSDPLQPRACTADLVGAVYFVVALRRDALPESPFTVRLREDGVGGADARLELDLRD